MSNVTREEFERIEAMFNSPDPPFYLLLPAVRRLVPDFRRIADALATAETLLRHHHPLEALVVVSAALPSGWLPDKPAGGEGDR